MLIRKKKGRKKRMLLNLILIIVFQDPKLINKVKKVKSFKFIVVFISALNTKG